MIYFTTITPDPTYTQVMKNENTALCHLRRLCDISQSLQYGRKDKIFTRRKIIAPLDQSPQAVG